MDEVSSCISFISGVILKKITPQRYIQNSVYLRYISPIQLLMIKHFALWIQDVNLTYIRRQENALDIF